MSFSGHLTASPDRRDFRRLEVSDARVGAFMFRLSQFFPVRRFMSWNRRTGASCAGEIERRWSYRRVRCRNRSLKGFRPPPKRESSCLKAALKKVFRYTLRRPVFRRGKFLHIRLKTAAAEKRAPNLTKQKFCRMDVFPAPAGMMPAFGDGGDGAKGRTRLSETGKNAVTGENMLRQSLFRQQDGFL